MSRLRLAIVGFGRLGRACARVIADATDIDLVGVVRHEPAGAAGAFAHVAAVGHIRDLGRVDAALVCVPTEQGLAVASELLQERVPIVECARIEGHAQKEHYQALDAAAHRHRVPAIVGAGWEPGALPSLQRLFEVLIPRGHTLLTRHPGIALHHSAALDDTPGVKEALTGELRDARRGLRRYVYVELRENASLDAVRRSIESDPLFAAESMEIFAVPDLAALEAPSGVVIERRSETTVAGERPSLTLDARLDAWSFAARVMCDAAAAIPCLSHGAHRYGVGLMSLSRAASHT